MTRNRLKEIIREEVKRLDEGHDGEMGPSRFQDVKKAVKDAKDSIEHDQKYGGDLENFRGVKFVGTVSSEDRLDKVSMKYEDDYIVIAILDGEV